MKLLMTAISELLGNVQCFAAPSQKHSIYFFTSEKSMSLRYNTGCQFISPFQKPPNRFCKSNVGETLWIDGNCWFVPFTWLKMHCKHIRLFWHEHQLQRVEEFTAAFDNNLGKAPYKCPTGFHKFKEDETFNVLTQAAEKTQRAKSWGPTAFTE